jgi:superfamily II DNA/RNA helicase
VPLVINYDIPRNPANYLHRAGPATVTVTPGTGVRLAAGPPARRGAVVVIFLTADDDARTLLDIEQFHNIQIEELPMNFADLIKQ